MHCKPGVSDLLTLHPDVAAELVSADPYTTSAQSNISQTWKCPAGHTYQRTPAGQVKMKPEKRCRDCNSLWFNRPDLFALLKEPDASLTLGSQKQVVWVCQEMGHEFTRSTYQMTAHGSTCEECRSISVTHPELAAFVVDQELARKLSYSSHKRVEWRCVNEHTYKKAVQEVCSQGSGCKECKSLGFLFPDLAEELVNPKDAMRGAFAPARVDWRCRACGHLWPTSIATRTLQGSGCPKCAPHGYNPGKPGSVYLIMGKGPDPYASDFATLVKFGITNDPDTRLARHKRQNMAEVLVMRSFTDGAIAKLIENGCMERLKESGATTAQDADIEMDGVTETFVLDGPDAEKLLRSLKRFIKNFKG